MDLAGRPSTWRRSRSPAGPRPPSQSCVPPTSQPKRTRLRALWLRRSSLVSSRFRRRRWPRHGRPGNATSSSTAAFAPMKRNCSSSFSSSPVCGCAVPDRAIQAGAWRAQPWPRQSPACAVSAAGLKYARRSAPPQGAARFGHSRGRLLGHSPWQQEVLSRNKVSSGQAKTNGHRPPPSGARNRRAATGRRSSTRCDPGRPGRASLTEARPSPAAQRNGAQQDRRAQRTLDLDLAAVFRACRFPRETAAGLVVSLPSGEFRTWKITASPLAVHCTRGTAHLVQLRARSVVVALPLARPLI